MIKLAHTTSARVLRKVKIGDTVIDEYQTQGRVVKISKKVENGIAEYLFHLDSKQTVHIMSIAI